MIKGDNNRKYLSPLPQKIEKLETMGVDRLFVTEFDKKFASAHQLILYKILL
ncbi:FAD synthetase [Natribacillus halophilus]|uniref:FAD synthase n=1 Tax=Natribacillus halophilus TaxID=549003 RepID=A0A1G8MX14_9BACI|nr:FAD synthetase [Natribacillus halophilus]